jgi:histidine triad (HIT) family protein
VSNQTAGDPERTNAARRKDNLVDCVFCRIVAGTARSDIVYQDDTVTAFRDVNPQAPTHILVVPNQHLASITDAGPQHDELLGRMFSVANRLAVDEGIAQTGYRLVINRGDHAGQSVFHLHLHLLGGRRMRWPPG